MTVPDFRYDLRKVQTVKYSSKVEAFNKYALRYCPKLYDFKDQHPTRIGSAVLDFNVTQFQNLAKYDDVDVDFGFHETWRLEFLKLQGIIDKF